MPIWVEYILAFLLVAGGVFAFIGSYGLAKLNDFYMRLHGPTKATTLGLGCILTVSAVYFTMTAGVMSLHEYLIVVFLFITAPVSAHLLSKTALAEGFHYTSDQSNPLDHPLNVATRQTHDATGIDDLADSTEAYKREMRAEEVAMMQQAHEEDDAFEEAASSRVPAPDSIDADEDVGETEEGWDESTASDEGDDLDEEVVEEAEADSEEEVVEEAEADSDEEVVEEADAEEEVVEEAEDAGDGDEEGDGGEPTDKSSGSS